MRVFNFKELVPNGHVTVTEDGMLYAVELVMVVNGSNRVVANHTLSRVKEEHFSLSKLSIKKMPVKGNGHCKLVTFENAIDLLMALPGEGAKEYRSKFADVIKRFLAGDKTLVEEINANAESNAPIHQMARDACSSAGDVENEGIVGIFNTQKMVVRRSICYLNKPAYTCANPCPPVPVKKGANVD